jgi:hypothetical protein
VTIDDRPVLDHTALDLEAADRVTYRIEQGFRYEYDTPVTAGAATSCRCAAGPAR